jgi:hypothetical protein
LSGVCQVGFELQEEVADFIRFLKEKHKLKQERPLTDFDVAEDLAKARWQEG